MSVLLSRRRVLKTLSFGAGAALLSPFIAQLGRAQTTGDFPRRFVFILEGNSSEPINFLAANAKSALTTATGRNIDNKRWFYGDYVHPSPLVVPATDFASAPGLGSVVTDGAGGVSLESDAAVLLGLSSKISGGGHTTYHGALSCFRSSGASPAGITIDAHLALNAAVRNGAPFDAFRVGISASNDPLNYQTCAYKKGQAAPIILNPTTAFNTLFGSVASAAGQAAFSKRENLLTFARDDVNRALAVFSGSSPERAKLEDYLASIEKLLARNARISDLELQTGALTANKPVDPQDNPLVTSGRPLDTLQAHFDIAEAALKGGLTNVVVIASGTGGAFGVTYSSVTNVDRHNLQHGSGGNPAYLAAVHTVTRRHIEMATRLARNLKATSEPGGGNMLDHTAIVFMSDNGEQHHSTASDWPMLLLGGNAMGLQTGGRTIIYPGIGRPGHRQVSNVYNTFGYAAGEALDTFGDERTTRVAEGPLTELYG